VAHSLPESPIVLIVEDEALLRMSLAESLKDCGFHPIEACDAHEAIEILQQAVHIDAVLTDVKMPGTIDGFGLAKWIRENRSGLPVFVASGFSGKLDIARELCAGEQFFAKPYDVSHIATRMKTVVGARRTEVTRK
jgi:CheY-like chemotaxis protein